MQPPTSGERLFFSKESMRYAAPVLRRAQKLTLLELQGRTDDEIYELCFARLLKPDPWVIAGFKPPQSSEAVLMMGTDQRDLFVPLLRREAEFLNDNAKVADLGCGDGQTSRFLWEKLKSNITLDVLDPVPAYVSAYQHLTSSFDRIHLRSAQRGTLDQWVQSQSVRSLGSTAQSQHVEVYNLIIMIHSLYFANNLSDLIESVADSLGPRGRLFLVFADELDGFTGKVVASHLRSLKSSRETEYIEQIAARHNLFGISGPSASGQPSTGHFGGLLRRDDLEICFVERQMSRIYGHDFCDLLAAGFITGLASASHMPLEDKIAGICDILENEPDSVGLAVELNGPRTRMLSVSQPQYVIAISKKP